MRKFYIFDLGKIQSHPHVWLGSILQRTQLIKWRDTQGEWGWVLGTGSAHYQVTSLPCFLTTNTAGTKRKSIKCSFTNCYQNAAGIGDHRWNERWGILYYWDTASVGNVQQMSVLLSSPSLWNMSCLFWVTIKWEKSSQDCVTFHNLYDLKKKKLLKHL